MGILEHQHHLSWLDWEEAIYSWLRPSAIHCMELASDFVWEDFHKKTWRFIRGVQAENRAKEAVVKQVAKERNLPPLVEGALLDFAVVKGTREMDYRWFLHDCRKQSPYLSEMKYGVRECIASFLIHPEAFELSKDDIVDLFCE